MSEMRDDCACRELFCCDHRAGCAFAIKALEIPSDRDGLIRVGTAAALTVLNGIACEANVRRAVIKALAAIEQHCWIAPNELTPKMYENFGGKFRSWCRDIWGGLRSVSPFAAPEAGKDSANG